MIGLLIFGAIGLVLLSVYDNNYSYNSLPRKVAIHSKSEIKSMDGVFAILGTGSMAPYIKGGNPTAIVAYAATDKNIKFIGLRKQDLVIYRNGNSFIIHQLVGNDSAGWIVSGYNNKFYDSGRVTEENFVGKVVLVYELE
jgi:hypothetical protein